MYTRAQLRVSRSKLRRYSTNILYSNKFRYSYLCVKNDYYVKNYRYWLDIIGCCKRTIETKIRLIEVGREHSCGRRRIDAFLQVGLVRGRARERRGTSWPSLLQEERSSGCHRREPRSRTIAARVFPENIWPERERAVGQVSNDASFSNSHESSTKCIRLFVFFFFFIKKSLERITNSLWKRLIL